MNAKCTRSVLVLVIMASGSAEAWAQNVPDVIPYHGYVERDGFTVEGPLELVFELTYDGGALWSESYLGADSIDVVAGHFFVLLGSTTAIPPTFFQEETLELQVYEEVVLCDGCGASLEPLGPAQSIAPFPYALWTTGGSDFDVQGDLSVTGTIAATSVVLGGGIRAEANDLGAGGLFQVTDVAARVQGSSITGTELDSSTDITTGDGSMFSVGNQLTVGGGISFDGGSGNGDGGLALSYAASDTLVFGSGLTGPVRIDGAVTVNAAKLAVSSYCAIGGSLIADAWTLNGSRAFFSRTLHNEGQGDGYYVFSGLGAQNWFCWPGGVEMLTGDICESSTSNCGGGPIFANYTYYTTGEWVWAGYMAFLTHGSDDSDLENIRVGYICAQTGLVGIVCDGAFVCSPSSDNAGTGCTADTQCTNGYCEPDWRNDTCNDGSNRWFGDPF